MLGYISYGSLIDGVRFSWEALNDSYTNGGVYQNAESDYKFNQCNAYYIV